MPDAMSIRTYVEDGARIAAILLVWGIIGAFFRYGLIEVTLSFRSLWIQLGTLFWYVGGLNAVLYVLYRTVDYWHANA